MSARCAAASRYTSRRHGDGSPGSIPRGGYGSIATPDGREVYFHRNSVVHADFDRLRIGDELRFAEEAGEQGSQASTVHLLGEPFTNKKRR